MTVDRPKSGETRARRRGGEQQARRRAHVVRSNRKVGIALSGIAIALLLAATVWVLVGGLTGADAESTLTAGVVTAFFGAVFAIPGEQLRRGVMGTRDGDTSGLVRSRFRMLSLRTHVLWVVVGTALTGLCVVAPAVSWSTGGWPHAPRDNEGLSLSWITYGAFTFGVTTATVTSLVKKVCYLRTADRPAPSRNRFWRWVLYRWRFDIWLGGIGGFVTAVSVTALPQASDDGDGSVATFVAIAVAGAVVVLLGAALSTRFRRSGELLGSGEGASRPDPRLTIPTADV